MSVRRTICVVSIVLGFVLGWLGVVPPAGAAAAPSYYLSLGDSLAFGYQPDLVAAGDLNAADYRSYAEDYAAMRPNLTLINFGCPGETTHTMLAGGCPWPGTLHDSYGGAGSQAAAALAFLSAHQGEVSLISIDIGSNDLLSLVDGCQGAANPQQCILNGLPSSLAALATNYATLLTELVAAAPGAHLVLFNYYNPLALDLPGSDELTGLASNLVDQLATAFHATVADAFETMNHVAGSPSERAFLCTRTWECTSFHNIHPTDLGYRALAIALLAAA